MGFYRQAQSSRTAEFRSLLALVCIALMFVATLAQALDSHDLGIARESSQTNASVPAVASPGVCLVCVAAHSPSVVAHVGFFHSVERSYVSRSRVAVNFRSLLPVFDLSVRPPPAV